MSLLPSVTLQSQRQQKRQFTVLLPFSLRPPPAPSFRRLGPARVTIAFNTHPSLPPPLSMSGGRRGLAWQEGQED
eukprot:9476423-Pyramimonas_sp.AAC.1